MVATEFGTAARHGGPDSRSLPFAQPTEEVVAVIMDLLARPQPEAYTRGSFRGQVAAYYGAEDLATVEGQPPYAPRR